MYDKKKLSILKSNGKERYKYFLKKVAEYEEVWGLYDDGWATSEDDEGNILIPFWPTKEYAEYCANKEWERYQPKKINLSEFIEKWIPGMIKNHQSISIFSNGIDTISVDLIGLKNDLEHELENYNYQLVISKDNNKNIN